MVQRNHYNHNYHSIRKNPTEKHSRYPKKQEKHTLHPRLNLPLTNPLQIPIKPLPRPPRLLPKPRPPPQHPLAHERTQRPAEHLLLHKKRPAWDLLRGLEAELMRACEDVGEGAGPGEEFGGVLLGVVLDREGFLWGSFFWGGRVRGFEETYLDYGLEGGGVC